MPPNRAALRFAILLLAAALPAAGASIPTAPEKPAAPARDEEATRRQLEDAAGAVVAVRTRAVGNARSNETLGAERSGSGILIAPSGLVLTIGYLILEADQVEVTDSGGRVAAGDRRGLRPRHRVRAAAPLRRRSRRSRSAWAPRAASSSSTAS